MIDAMKALQIPLKIAQLKEDIQKWAGEFKAKTSLDVERGVLEIWGLPKDFKLPRVALDLMGELGIKECVLKHPDGTVRRFQRGPRVKAVVVKTDNDRLKQKMKD